MQKPDNNTLPLEIAMEDVPTNKDTIVIDCRTQEEYEESHLERSICIPLQHISLVANELPCTVDDPIFVYCRSGNRSATFATYLRSIGYTKCQSIEGGYSSWGDQ